MKINQVHAFVKRPVPILIPAIYRTAHIILPKLALHAVSAAPLKPVGPATAAIIRAVTYVYAIKRVATPIPEPSRLMLFILPKPVRHAEEARKL